MYIWYIEMYICQLDEKVYEAANFKHRTILFLPQTSNLFYIYKTIHNLYSLLNVKLFVKLIFNIQ